MMIKNLLKSENPSISPVSQQPNSLTTNERFVTYYALCNVLSRKEKQFDISWSMLVQGTSNETCKKICRRIRNSHCRYNVTLFIVHAAAARWYFNDIFALICKNFVTFLACFKKKKKKKLKQTKFESPWHRGKMMQMYGNAENV